MYRRGSCARPIPKALRAGFRPAQTPPPRRRGPSSMITINGPSSRYCDGIDRRSFLRIGALGVGAGALTLADLFRLEAAGATRPASSKHKAVIMVFLGGGPPHQDM